MEWHIYLSGFGVLADFVYEADARACLDMLQERHPDAEFELRHDE